MNKIDLVVLPEQYKKDLLAEDKLSLTQDPETSTPNVKDIDWDKPLGVNINNPKHFAEQYQTLPIKQRKFLIIHHAHCNDGFGAAWAVWSKLVEASEFRKKNIILHAAAYGDEVPWDLININTEVYIVDFSYQPENMYSILNECSSLTWIDHHKTAIESWESYSSNLPTTDGTINIVLDKTHSGAALAYSYCYPDKSLPNLIKYIQDRDLWIKQLQGTEAFHLNLSTQPQDLDYWSIMCEALESEVNLSNFIAQGEAIKRYYDDTIRNIIATNKVYCYIDGVQGLACNAPGRFASDIGHILATESGTYGLTWEEQNGGIEKISLRSNGDYDISTVARSFGGGGHKNAAGFVLDVKNTTDRIRFKPI